MMRVFLFALSILCVTHFTAAQDYCSMDRFDTYLWAESDIEVFTNLEYGQAVNNSGNNEHLFLDLYHPPVAEDPLTYKPCVFFVHGGGLVGGDKDSEGAKDLGYLYARMGYVFVSIDYRVGWNNGDADDGCGGDSTDLRRATYRAVQDTRAAYRWIKAYGPLYGVDTNNIIVEGNSAGSMLLLYALYADQEDYDPMFYDELGSIDSAVNELTNFGFDPIGCITEAAGIEDTTLLLIKDVPHLFFHGTCDSIVPFFHGPTFFCFQPFPYPTMNGSWPIVQMFKRNDRNYHFYIAEGAGHDAVIPDSIIVYSAPFIKEILCNASTTKEFYRVLGKFKCAVANEGELVITDVYPNPVVNTIYLEVTSTRQREITIDVYNNLGQSVLSGELPFTPPIGEYTIDLSHLTRGIYYMRLSQRQEEYVLKFVKY
ncbi:MAG TPA: T9SS type A sorting domain-containing protein [Chitinophagales bacterium]|nr:T9SS type A sorting domain-containing protein [Chitinophagales bacterium]HMX03104.1 T9SS type A sorting domain-containing protein [Chitinophagales bacterium]HMZ88124.1 T9SS type A sorting domain-containing protein [Chitinophagales bacterium]HNJ88005.1 T9SS type A sorting domain-containing protein [Chitinophagales bacterium]HNM07349.1 T9SS type A sorting domain-containing protein [Chitinophagales bacterium]